MRFNWKSPQFRKWAAGCVVGLGSLGIVAYGIAQAVHQPTIEELVDQAQRKADAMREQMGDLTPATADKMKIYQDQARDLAQGNHDRIRTGLTYLGNGYTADTLEQPTDADTKNGVVYVAVSLSMPVSSLRQLVRDAEKAHVQVAIQGPVDGSFKKTMTLMRSLFSEGEAAGVVIDPRVFRDYKVTEVPTFIAAPAPVENCEEGIDCDRPQQPADTIRGNVHLEYALQQLASRGDVAPAAAKDALARLRD